MKYEGIENLPPLRYSICQKFTVADCTSLEIYGSDFNHDRACRFKKGKLPNYTNYNNSADFWKFTGKMGGLEKNIQEIAIWNRNIEDWEDLINVKEDKAYSNYRRVLFKQFRIKTILLDI